MSAFWTAAVEVSGREVLRCLLPRERVTVGRAEHAGLRVQDSWVSAVQAEFMPLEHGHWIVLNGTRTRLRVKSKRVWVTARPGAATLLERGSYGPVTLMWPELDGRLEVQLEYGEGAAPSLPIARDKPSPGFSRQRNLTAMAGAQARIDGQLRHRMAVLFQHLIDDTEPPSNLYKHASAALGGMETEANLKTAAHRLMRRINKQRRTDHPIEDVEALGYYLIHTSKAVAEADLAQPFTQEDAVT
jgi:hypothetical protein